MPGENSLVVCGDVVLLENTLRTARPGDDPEAASGMAAGVTA
jgi:hypothetical protein